MSTFTEQDRSSLLERLQRINADGAEKIAEVSSARDAELDSSPENILGQLDQLIKGASAGTDEPYQEDIHDALNADAFGTSDEEFEDEAQYVRRPSGMSKAAQYIETVLFENALDQLAGNDLDEYVEKIASVRESLSSGSDQAPFERY